MESMHKLIKKKIKSSCNVEYSSNTYDECFWDKVETGDYKPDAQFNLKRSINSNTIFLDLGTAEIIVIYCCSSKMAYKI